MCQRINMDQIFVFYLLDIIGNNKKIRLEYWLCLFISILKILDYLAFSVSGNVYFSRAMLIDKTPKDRLPSPVWAMMKSKTVGWRSDRSSIRAVLEHLTLVRKPVLTRRRS